MSCYQTLSAWLSPEVSSHSRHSAPEGKMKQALWPRRMRPSRPHSGPELGACWPSHDYDVACLLSSQIKVLYLMHTHFIPGLSHQTQWQDFKWQNDSER